MLQESSERRVFVENFVNAQYVRVSGAFFLDGSPDSNSH
jgi:hypothetical protein